MQDEAWTSRSVKARLALLSARDAFPDIYPLLEQDCRHVLCSMDEAIPLSGPTGESNELYVEPRGAFVVFVEPNFPWQTVLPIVVTRLLLAGNSVEIGSVDNVSILRFFSGLLALLPDGVLSINERNRINLDDAGVVCLGDIAFTDCFRQQITQRQGAIIPLIWVNSMESSIISPYAAIQWVHERTRTVNCTAIGGNASLLALNE
ncbi:hypothetical protein [Thaumasiovibrio sp. DFM-14]|uniref:hypothetical protein n=1 Tax=Thaumasiovibrio sp. DFM-14 TaxID=3384792 RepID=UPI0039A2FF5B